MNSPPPTLRLKVDKDALASNWRALDAMSGTAKAGAAIKADCYGLGVDTCVPVLRDAGCAHFFVAHWSEVAAAAKHVDPAQIAVLHGVINDEEIAYAKAVGAVPVINSLTQAQRWHKSGGGRCHLMVDTGINRLGVNSAELSDPAIQNLDVDVLMSHLARADEDVPMNALQLEVFREALPKVKHRVASLANSAGIALGEGYAFDLTRPGLCLYGGIARGELMETIKQVAYVEAAILQTRQLKAGDKVGYNSEFTAPKDMKVATVSIGYADGFLRSRGKGTALLHGEAALPILGKVSMDMVVVDCGSAPDVSEGDWLEVPLSLENAAQQTPLSQYELLTTLGQRLRT